MSGILAQPWFLPAVVVSVGLPIALIALTELANALVRDDRTWTDARA